MGNTKSYRIECELRVEEVVPPIEIIREAFRSDEFIAGEVFGYERHLIVAGISDSQSSDQGLSYLAAVFPDRWLRVERYDHDWSDFRVYLYNKDGETDVVVADNWHKIDGSI